jgi:hypothetical protein
MENTEQNGQPRPYQLEHVKQLLIANHLTFEDEHKKLLTAQVVLTDRLDRLTDRLDRLAVSVQELRDSGKHSDDRLKALITLVDGLNRDRPLPYL